VSPQIIDAKNIHQANLLVLHRALSALHKKLALINDDVGAGLARPHNRSGRLPPSLKLWRTRKLAPTLTHVLIDGRFMIPAWSGSQEAVIDGDAKIFSIAAASILAKVYRDQLMMKQDAQFPGYGFSAHKGYGTAAHCAAIRQHGLTPIHRRSFCSRILSGEGHP
jgi:hypothetical protein